MYHGGNQRVVNPAHQQAPNARMPCTNHSNQQPVTLARQVASAKLRSGLLDGRYLSEWLHGLCYLKSDGLHSVSIGLWPIYTKLYLDLGRRNTVCFFGKRCSPKAESSRGSVERGLPHTGLKPTI